MLPSSSEPRAARGAKVKAGKWEEEVVHASDPQLRFKRILLLLNTNIYFEYKVML